MSDIASNFSLIEEDATISEIDSSDVSVAEPGPDLESATSASEPEQTASPSSLSVNEALDEGLRSLAEVSAMLIPKETPPVLFADDTSSTMSVAELKTVSDHSEATAPVLPQLEKSEPTIIMKEDIQLNSLVPLFELLPAWQNDEGHFVLSGEITDNDVERVTDYAERVTEFVYRATADNVSNISISPSAYIRFLQCVPTSLFPSLYSVQILSVPPQLHYLPLLCRTSLTRLEVGDIAPSAVHLVKSLLATLPYEAPGIECLQLRGPQKLPETSLYPIAQLKQLVGLELEDIVALEGTSLLERLSTLPLLEDINIVMKTSGSARILLLEESAVHDAGFPNLQHLCITGSLDHILQIVRLVSSTELNTLRLDVLLEEHSEQVAQIRKTQEMEARLAREEKMRLKESQIKHARNDVESMKARVTIAETKLASADRAFKELSNDNRARAIEKKLERPKASGATGAELNEVVRKMHKEAGWPVISVYEAMKASKVNVEKLALEVAALRASVSIKENTLKKLASSSLSVDEPRDIPTPPPSADRIAEWQQKMDQVTETIAARWRESMEDFTMTLSTDGQFCASVIPSTNLSPILDSIESGWPNLHTLHLPLETVSAMSFDDLQSIAMCCPQLRSLQTKLDVSPLPQLPADSGATFALLHGLNMLVVDSDASVIVKQGRTLIARYLNVLFPYLKTISSPASGEAAEMWEEVNEQVKLFQLIRGDDTCRFHESRELCA